MKGIKQMKNVIKRVVAAALLVPVLAFGVTLVPAGLAYADTGDQIREGIDATNDDPSSSADLNDVFKTVVNVSVTLFLLVTATRLRLPRTLSCTH